MKIVDFYKELSNIVTRRMTNRLSYSAASKEVDELLALAKESGFEPNVDKQAILSDVQEFYDENSYEEEDSYDEDEY